MSGDFVSQLLEILLTFEVLAALLVVVVVGIISGGLRGLRSTVAVALLVQASFAMTPVAGLVMLTAIYPSAIYGGSIASLLLHTPGTPAAAATALDGYQLTL